MMAGAKVGEVLATRDGDPLATHPASGVQVLPSVTVAGRYDLRRRLGHGGHGEVWEALDTLTDTRVAVKLLRARARSLTAATRREIAALRAVQVPGVVRLLDEGLWDDWLFLVLELVEGRPFPGWASPMPWAALREPTLALLEILGRIHTAGVVHRDLKPGNVLVNGEGRPVVLDFGVSWGTLDAVATPVGEVVGTPAYVSPEQVQGARATAVSDLYALGVMLYEALSGRFPFQRSNSVAAMLSRCVVDAPALRTVCPEVPELVAATVDALLQRAPERRPGSAREVLERLAGRPSLRSPEDALDGPPLDLPALATMIHGSQRIFHVPEDAAVLLLARTGGDRRRVRAELDGWVRMGLARREGAGVALDRAALELLLEDAPVKLPEGTPALRASAHRTKAAVLAPGTEGRLRHLVRALEGADHGAEELVQEATATAQRRMAQGRSSAALAALAEGWMAARRLEEPCSDGATRALFSVWTECALLDGVPASVDRALYELARLPEASGLKDLDALLRASLAARTGGERGLALASALRFEAAPLELCRHAVRLQAARRCPSEVETRVLEDLAAWGRERPSDSAVHASVLGWRGRNLYRLRRFEEAARCQEQAAERDPSVLRRFGWLAGAASANLSAGHPARARLLAEALGALASGARHAYAEAWAEYLVRAARYQSSEVLEVDHGLLGAFELLSDGDLFALLLTKEAAIAFREGEADLALALAAKACDRWRASDWRPAYALCRALAIHLGAPAEETEVQALADLALRSGQGEVALQVLGLLSHGRSTIPASWLEASQPLLADIPAASRELRLSVISAQEAATWLQQHHWGGQPMTRGPLHA